MSKTTYRITYISANSLGNRLDNFAEFEHFDDAVREIEWYIQTFNPHFSARCQFHRTGAMDWRAENGAGFHITALASL